ncbi:hypothetical protein D915_007774 [Fasciola hepatica]|uniref:Uncharacterized protein n=1 Tax=Fasciola hepatica TaxID=6192 RepID=A0A2H1C1U6_FASHE|nr:hypothetical protein D915_007774 [Fasciola hepatica]
MVLAEERQIELTLLAVLPYGLETFWPDNTAQLAWNARSSDSFKLNQRRSIRSGVGQDHVRHPGQLFKMNPNRRVGVLPKDENDVGDLGSITTQEISHRDVEDMELNGEIDRPFAAYHRFSTKWIQFYEDRRFNLLSMNDILAAVYICLGCAILLVSLIFRPSNRLFSGNMTCYHGYCFVRNMSRSSVMPAHHHAHTDAYHPFTWTPSLIAIALIAYGLVVLFRITLTTINAGNVNNWAVAVFCFFGVIHACVHLDRNWFGAFHPIFWLEGVSHTFFEPLLIIIAWFLTTFQAVVNLPYVQVQRLDYYSELVRHSILIQESEKRNNNKDLGDMVS